MTTTLAELRSRFASTERRGGGVVARTLLCRRTAPCDDGAASDHRWAGLQARACGSSFDECVESELAGVTARWSGRLDSMRFEPAHHGPASLLRWDLPLAIFAPDTCPCAACHCPADDLPAAIGWLFRELPPERHAFAFSHDAFTDDPKELRRPCDYARLARGRGDEQDASQISQRQETPPTQNAKQPAAPRRAAARAYAAARLAATRRGRKATERFLSEGEWSCYHRGAEDAARWQREFATALRLARLGQPTHQPTHGQRRRAGGDDAETMAATTAADAPPASLQVREGRVGASREAAARSQHREQPSPAHQPSSRRDARQQQRHAIEQRRWLCPSAALGAYNQVHVSWNRSLLAAVFYVNATTAAVADIAGLGTGGGRRGVSGAQAARLPTTTTAQLLASAAAARAAALRVSELSAGRRSVEGGSSGAARGPGELLHGRLPLVQLRLGTACDDARRANGTTARQRREIARALLVL